MILYETPDASLTYHPDTAMLRLSYNALSLATGFQPVYELALAQLHCCKATKLLLDLKRNAPPGDNDEYWLLAPLARTLTSPFDHSIFIAAVVSEGQYQYQIGNHLASPILPPAWVEFNYFTSRREATAWLSAN